MIVLFFIYGLAFFVLGFSIFIYPKKRSALKISNNLWLIAAFGISHGLNEWVDMFSLIQAPVDATYLKVIRLFILPVSFYFLVLFGVKTLEKTEKKSILLGALPVLLPLAWAFMVAMSSNRFLIGGIMARYLLGIPGTILTSLALFSLLTDLEKTNTPVLIGSLKWAAGAFSFYGLFAGFIVQNADFYPASFFNYTWFTDIADIPVQVARTLCAAIISVCVIRVLAVFDWEAKKALRESEERYRTLAETARDAIFVIDRQDRVEYINRYGADLFGRHPNDIIGRPRETLFPAAANVQQARLREVIETGMPSCAEGKTAFPNGDRWLSTQLVPLRNELGDVISVMGISRDITEQKRIEEQLLQAQKMEVVGQLSGGRAHDFTNILTAVVGFGNLLKMDLEEDNPQQRYVDQILGAADKASRLTQSLLAFSRKQIVNLKIVRLNEVVARFHQLLQRVIGEDIELKAYLSTQEAPVLVDSVQIEQVLMNLCTNARDAMPEGGILMIETEVVELDKEYARTHALIKPGKYMLISISDTGYGMDENTKARIFEPFFTTKEVGKGTGLGLSTAYGIIRQHEGYINVYSEKGKGTTFKIYLPVAEGVAETTGDEKPALDMVSRPNLKGTETLLLAEDDTSLREYTKNVLEENGYRVLTAENGDDALEKFKAHPNPINLLILDVIMPKKNGKEVYDEIKNHRPGMKALFMSGYTANIIHSKGILKTGINLITKPFTPRSLLQKVREVLDKT